MRSARWRRACKGSRAVKWRLVDQSVPNSKFEQAVKDAAKKLAATSDRPADAKGIALTPIERTFDDDAVAYSSVKVDIDRSARRATLTIRGPSRAAAGLRRGSMHEQGAQFWPLRLARELDDAILHLRLNEPEIGVLDLQDAGRCRPGAGLRRVPRGQPGPLARARDPALLEARAEAHRRHLALAGGADRARLLLCRHAGRDRVRLRPLLHAGRRVPGRQPPAGDASRCRRSTSAPIR